MPLLGGWLIKISSINKFPSPCECLFFKKNMERTFCIYGRDSLFGCHVESPSDAFLCRANGEVCKQQIDQTLKALTFLIF